MMTFIKQCTLVINAKALSLTDSRILPLSEHLQSLNLAPSFPFMSLDKITASYISTIDGLCDTAIKYNGPPGSHWSHQKKV